MMRGELVQSQKSFSIKRKNRIGKLIGKGLRALFVTLSSLSKKSPMGNLERWGVEAQFDIPYDSEIPERMLDIYRPINSKIKNCLLSCMFMVVFVLCPRIHIGLWQETLLEQDILLSILIIDWHQKIHTQQDLKMYVQAWKWLYENIESIGGDAEKVIVAGESAGANLTLALTLACTLPRTENFAREIYDLKFIPKAILPMCVVFLKYEIRNAF